MASGRDSGSTPPVTPPVTPPDGGAEEMGSARRFQSEGGSEVGSAYAVSYMQSLHSKVDRISRFNNARRQVSVNSTSHKLRARTHMWQSIDSDLSSGSSSLMKSGGKDDLVMTTSGILDAHLDVRRRDAWLRLFRLDRIFQAARKERHKRARLDYEHSFPLINQAVKSTTFELVIGLVMCVNATLIGIQTSVAGTPGETEFYDIMEHVFTLLFTAEVIVRVISDGWPWLLNPMNAWDALLIFFTGVIPMWFLQPLGVDSSSLRLFSLVRVLRMIKLVRTVRMVPMFHILYHLVSGLLGSVRLLLFTYVMMGITLYMLAVFGVYWVSKLRVFRNDEVVQEHFATVPSAALTLLQVATCEWTQLARLLMVKSWVIVGLCVVVIMVVTLVLFNLITAAMCNAANDRAKDDEEILARVKRDALAAEVRELEDLFWELDMDHNGMISKQEYLLAVNGNRRVKAKFHLLGVGPGDVEEIWQLLADDNGEIDIDAFTNTLRALQGDALAKDSFAILKRVQFTNDRMWLLKAKLEVLLDRADSLRGQASVLDKELGQALVDLSEFLAGLGACMPREAATPSRRNGQSRTVSSEAEGRAATATRPPERRAAPAATAPAATPQQTEQRLKNLTELPVNAEPRLLNLAEVELPKRQNGNDGNGERAELPPRPDGNGSGNGHGTSNGEGEQEKRLDFDCDDEGPAAPPPGPEPPPPPPVALVSQPLAPPEERLPNLVEVKVESPPAVREAAPEPAGLNSSAHAQELW